MMTMTDIPESLRGVVGNAARAREAELLAEAADAELDARYREGEIAAGHVAEADLVGIAAIVTDPAIARNDLPRLRDDWMDAVLLGDAMIFQDEPMARDRLLALWPDRLDTAVRHLARTRAKIKAAHEINARRYCNDWPTDPRPLAECLADWATRHDVTWGVASWISEQLSMPERTVSGWLQGRCIPAAEPLIRQVMTSVDLSARRELYRGLPTT